MEKRKLFIGLFLPFFSLQITQGPNWPLVWPISREKVLAEHVLDLNERHPDASGNEAFKYNILLSLKYFEGNPDLPDSFTAEIELEPGEILAFHENLLPEFKDKAVKTGWTKFVAEEGYKAFGGLYGNGVCHLASLINWTASSAGLKVTALANHNFFPIPGVPNQYGTSIRYLSDNSWKTQNQNLYIENLFDDPIKLIFYSTTDEVKLRIVK